MLIVLKKNDIYRSYRKKEKLYYFLSVNFESNWTKTTLKADYWSQMQVTLTRNSAQFGRGGVGLVKARGGGRGYHFRSVVNVIFKNQVRLSQKNNSDNPNSSLKLSSMGYCKRAGIACIFRVNFFFRFYLPKWRTLCSFCVFYVVLPTGKVSKNTHFRANVLDIRSLVF